MYQSEEEFLKAYNPNQFERLSLTTDILIFSVSSREQANYRKLDEKNFSVLLVQRENYPFKDQWNFPGGFVGIDEDLEEAPKRILARETNLHDIYLEQLYTFGKVDRDPRMRIVSTAYMALVDKNRLKEQMTQNADWFDVRLLEDQDVLDIFLEGSYTTIHIKAKRHLVSPTTNRYDYEILENTGLAFDHALVLVEGIYRLKNKIQYTDIVFHMMPEYFTLGELQQVYEVILGKKLLDPAFRRIIADKVEKTSRLKKGEGHRPSALFRYRQKID